MVTWADGREQLGLVGSVLYQPELLPLIDLAVTGTRFHLSGNGLMRLHENLPLVDNPREIVLSEAELNGCNWPGCAQASGNLVGPPDFSFTPDPPHLHPESPLIDHGVDATALGGRIRRRGILCWGSLRRGPDRALPRLATAQQNGGEQQGKVGRPRW